MLFEYDKNIPDPEKGDFLISEPSMGDPNFDRTVILVCEHNEEGTFGLVMNQLTKLNLNDVLNEELLFEGSLFLGGPVEQNTLHFVHHNSIDIPGAVALNEELSWSGDFEEVKWMMKSGMLSADDIKFFLGYSGWGSGQLRDELDRQSWFVRKNARKEEVFDLGHDELWKAILNKMGGKYKLFSNYPPDPRLN